MHFPKDTELVSVRVSYRISDYGDSPLLFETPDSIARLLRFSVDAGGASYLPVAVGNDYILKFAVTFYLSKCSHRISKSIKNTHFRIYIICSIYV